MAAHRILVADDDAELTSVLALHLRNEGYEVITATEGIEVLDTARRRRPDLLVFDIALTAGEQHFLHQRICQHPDLVRIPILYMVGQRPSRAGTPKVPAKHSIHKPVAVSELLAKVEAILQPASEPRTRTRAA